MSRRKLLLQTNAPWLHTGLGSQGAAMMKYFLKRQDKYEFIYYMSQVMENDPNLARMPFKAYGAIPNNPQIIQQLNQDPGRARDVQYGGHFIDAIIKKEKIDLYVGSDDQWGFNGYVDKAWWNKINSILHITLDSRPILDAAFDSAKKSKHYVTWARFAELEMKRQGPQYSHVQTIYGASEPSNIEPISKEQKLDLRKRFGIDKDTTVFLMVNRNQLRKGHALCIQAFAEFKRENPNVKAKLHFHTSFSERGTGWDIEKLARFYGVKQDDILCTYVCRACGNWHIAPYHGEDIDCPYCKAQKSNVTASIVHGIPQEEMKYLYGIADGGLSIFNSGGLELMTTNSLFAGLYTAVTNYSCGEDFANLSFVHPVSWSPYHEPGSNFIKAASDVKSIKGFMAKVARISEKDREEIRDKARDYAVNTFGIDAVGARWEKLFDSTTPPDWSSIALDYKPKNEQCPIPAEQDANEWVKALYNRVLSVDPDPEGFKYWLAALERGVPRQDIYGYFIGEAKKENAKNSPPQDFSTQFDANGRKRILFVMKESGGDLFISTALFKGLKDLYPEADLYVGCDMKFAEVLAGNPYIHRLLPYHPAMEQELAMIQYVDHYYFPALATQRQLAYLSRDKIGLDLEVAK